jgi:hypothetical protein
MRIDQPDPIDAGDSDSPGKPGVPSESGESGVPHIADAERRGATEPAAEHGPRHEAETAAERTPGRKT